jgi:DNA/RNA endonuclease YhcR with UshA esterase domain
MKISFLNLLFVFCLMMFSKSVFSQKAIEEPFIAASNESGENASSLIDGMLVESKRSNERIFIIFRIGENERQTINNVRLHSTKQHFLNKKINLKNFVFAQGETVKGEGRIEFYLGGEMKLILLAKKNRMPNLTCCPV